MSCSKKKNTKPKIGGFACKSCGVGANKKKKLCKPKRVT